MQKYYPELLHYPEEEADEAAQPLPKPDDPDFALLHPEVQMEQAEAADETAADEEEQAEDEDEPMQVELPEWLR